MTARRAVLAAAAAALLSAGAWLSRFETPPATWLLRDRHGRFIAEVGDRGPECCGFWAIDPLPERVVAATLAIEDRRYWSHPGVDLVAVGRALRESLRAGRRASGASTIAMQVARLQRPGPRTLFRKAREALAAVAMTLRHGRRAVLAQYLRLVPYGNRVHGIADAARRYLDKPVDDLSWAEIAFLAAIPKSPSRMNPRTFDGRARAIRRGERILALLRGRDVLDRREYAGAVDELRSIAVPAPLKRSVVALHAVLRLERLLAESGRAGGGVVATTLDLDVQEDAARAVRDVVDRFSSQGAGNAAAVVLDRATGEVLGWVGSSGYFDWRRSGAIDFARVRRSPGSTLKPFVYALALERGVITPATVLDDLRPAAGEIVNADLLHLGPLLPRVALANSRNVPAALLAAELGVDDVLGFLRSLGLDDGAAPSRRWGLGVALGALPVTLESLARSYLVLAGDGRSRPLDWDAVRDGAEPRRIVSPETAREVTLFLADPMARLPTFPRMGTTEFPFPVAVKTGTSTGHHDAWTVAYSARTLVAAWIGRADDRPMSNLTGFGPAALLAHRILSRFHEDEAQGLHDLSFPPPAGTHAVRLCALSGKRATPACGATLTEWLRDGEEPEPCDAHVRLVVDRRTGERATAATPARFAEVETRVALPPRYASWAEAARLPTAPEGTPYGTRARTLRIVSPPDGLKIIRDPESPPRAATLPLEAVVDPPAAEVVWYADGRELAVAPRPYVFRWPIAAGTHVFEVRSPSGERSAPVAIVVR